MGNNDSTLINSADISQYSEPDGDPILENLKLQGRKSMNATYGDNNNTVYMELIKCGYFSYPLKHYKKLTNYNHINNIGATLYIYTFMYNIPILLKILSSESQCDKDLFLLKNPEPLLNETRRSTFLHMIHSDILPIYLERLLSQYNDMPSVHQKSVLVHTYITTLTYDVINCLEKNIFPQHKDKLLSLLEKIISPTIYFNFTANNSHLITDILNCSYIDDKLCMMFLSNYYYCGQILDSTKQSIILSIIISRDLKGCLELFIDSIVSRKDSSGNACKILDELQVQILNAIEIRLSNMHALSHTDLDKIRNMLINISNYISIEKISDKNTHLINFWVIVNAPDNSLQHLLKNCIDHNIKFRHMDLMFSIADKLGYTEITTHNEKCMSYYYSYIKLQEMNNITLSDIISSEEMYRCIVKCIEANDEQCALGIINSTKFHMDYFANQMETQAHYIELISHLIHNSHITIINLFINSPNQDFRTKFVCSLSIQISLDAVEIQVPIERIKEILTPMSAVYLLRIYSLANSYAHLRAIKTIDKSLTFIDKKVVNWNNILTQVLSAPNVSNASYSSSFIVCYINEIAINSHMSYQTMNKILQSTNALFNASFTKKILLNFYDIADFSAADSLIELHSKRFELDVNIIDHIEKNIRNDPNPPKNILLHTISKYYSDDEIVKYINYIGDKFDPNFYTNTFRLLYERKQFKSIRVFIEHGLTDIYQPEIMKNGELYKIKSEFLVKQILITACSVLEPSDVINIMINSTDDEIYSLCDEILKTKKLSTVELNILIANPLKVKSTILIDAIINNNRLIKNTNRANIQHYYTTILFPGSVEDELEFIALVLDVNKKNHPEFVKHIIKNHYKFRDDSYDMYEGILNAIMPRNQVEWTTEGYMSTICSSQNRIAFQIGMMCKIITDENQTEEFIDMLLEPSSIEFLCDFLDKINVDQLQFSKGLVRNNISHEQLNIILDSNKLIMNVQVDEYMQLSELMMHKILSLEKMYIPDLVDKLIMTNWPVIMYDIYKIFSFLIDDYDDIIFYICIKLFVKDDEGYASLEYDINSNNNRDLCVYNCLNNKSEELALAIMQTGKCTLGNSTIMGVHLSPSPLTIILTKGYDSILNYITQSYQIDNIQIDGNNILNVACNMKKYTLIRHIIANTPKDDVKSLDLSAYFLANIIEGDLDFIKICIKHNLFDIKYKNELGDSYFAIACKNNKDAIAIKLLESYDEIDVHDENNEGKSAIDYAIENNLESIKSSILKRKPKKQTSDVSSGECAICLDDEVEPNNNICTYVFEPCHHSFDIHDQCMASYKRNTTKCVSCRAQITKTFKIFRQSAS